MGEGLLISGGGSPDAVPLRPMAHSGQTASTFDTCKEAHYKATWCVGLRRFIGGLIKAKGEDVTWIDDRATE